MAARARGEAREASRQPDRKAPTAKAQQQSTPRGDSEDHATLKQDAARVTHAVTVQGPQQALAMLQGLKLCENRSWRIAPGWYALHVGGQRSSEWGLKAAEKHPELPSERELSNFHSAVVGLLYFSEQRTLAECAGNLWAYGPVCHIVARAVRLQPPVRLRGSPGLWPLPAKERGEILAQLRGDHVRVVCHDLSALDQACDSSPPTTASRATLLAEPAPLTSTPDAKLHEHAGHEGRNVWTSSSAAGKGWQSTSADIDRWRHCPSEDGQGSGWRRSDQYADGRAAGPSGRSQSSAADWLGEEAKQSPGLKEEPEDQATEPVHQRTWWPSRRPVGEGAQQGDESLHRGGYSCTSQPPARSQGWAAAAWSYDGVGTGAPKATQQRSWYPSLQGRGYSDWSGGGQGAPARPQDTVATWYPAPQGGRGSRWGGGSRSGTS